MQPWIRRKQSSSCWDIQPGLARQIRTTRRQLRAERKPIRRQGKACGLSGSVRVASQLLQGLHRLRERCGVCLSTGVPREFKYPRQRGQGLTLLVGVRQQPQVFARSARPVRLPDSVLLQKRDPRPVGEMDRFAPVVVRGGLARFSQPQLPAPRRNQDFGGYHTLLRARLINLSVCDKPEGQHRKSNESIDEDPADDRDGGRLEKTLQQLDNQAKQPLFQPVKERRPAHIAKLTPGKNGTKALPAACNVRCRRLVAVQIKAQALDPRPDSARCGWSLFFLEVADVAAQTFGRNIEKLRADADPPAWRNLVQDRRNCVPRRLQLGGGGQQLLEFRAINGSRNLATCSRLGPAAHPREQKAVEDVNAPERHAPAWAGAP